MWGKLAKFFLSWYLIWFRLFNHLLPVIRNNQIHTYRLLPIEHEKHFCLSHTWLLLGDGGVVSKKIQNNSRKVSSSPKAKGHGHYPSPYTSAQPQLSFSSHFPSLLLTFHMTWSPYLHLSLKYPLYTNIPTYTQKQKNKKKYPLYSVVT